MPSVISVSVVNPDAHYYHAEEVLRPEFYLQANLDIVAGRRRLDRCEAIHAEASVADDASLTESLVSAGARSEG